MVHRFKVREIAQQSGLSEATVDRVLHERPGVRESTRMEVQQAISDLDRQRSQLRLEGRKFIFDVVMHAPQRFVTEVREALEAEIPAMQPAVIRCRFHHRETGSAEVLVETLDRIAKRGSQGVLLKAPDVPGIVEAIQRLDTAGIPVVTMFTDVARSARAGYVGIDDRAAGSTAAYLMSQWLRREQGNILISLTQNFFRNEEEREAGFRATMRSLNPERRLIEIPDTDGIDDTVRRRAVDALNRDPSIMAAYSIGGGNRALLAAFEQAGRACHAFIAHDLDDDNTQLLRDGRVSAVLHHDLHADVRRACRLLLQARGALDGVPPSLSTIHIATPHNIPR
ncbi:LacI family DNA-binding transcriptional regulator [Hoyosella altamirensis]|uniref:LacI family transcriptional regulator n=1 Tax=Hoyosella altamirensis TaxID=616997 RepID=A0A839RU85_9ACTN|nr:LacI family DNA-binding transcriptional regulator [Hoyosella altamirensis]MBB3039778.1 LacI family transcriptional regulator [Hoyosella altamirensis]